MKIVKIYEVIIYEHEKLNKKAEKYVFIINILKIFKSSLQVGIIFPIIKCYIQIMV